VDVLGVDLRRLGRRKLDDFRGRFVGYADQHYWRALAGELGPEDRCRAAAVAAASRTM
jgi:hypothetical protein